MIAAKSLGEALRGVGYAEDSVDELLGPDTDVPDDAPVADRRLPRTPLGVAIRLLYFQLPLPHAEVLRALGERAVDALSATGLADVGDDVVPRVRILPVGSLLVASDDFPPKKDQNPPDYVAAWSPTSQICASLTVRRRVARALDVGTGSGVQALLAAQHADHVVATDVNERALAYTELNAALNGLRNVECRRGSFFEPVEGERFDLITCNAPYVVSPERRWTYRDAGFEGDELSRQLVEEAAEHLSDGGYATLMASWIAHDPAEPDERILEWVDATGCDAWILPIWETDALGHSATWNDHLVKDPHAFSSAIDAWSQYLEGLRARWVSEGAVVLRKSTEGHPTTRVDQLDEDNIDDASDQIQRAFAARARLDDVHDLADERLVVAAPLLLETEIEPRADGPYVVNARLEIDDGTHSAVEGDELALDLLASLDGTTPLGEEIVQSDGDASVDQVIDLATDLLEIGALRFAD